MKDGTRGGARGGDTGEAGRAGKGRVSKTVVEVVRRTSRQNKRGEEAMGFVGGGKRAGASYLIRIKEQRGTDQ